MIFFERTILDECISIDIAEILGGHNQATKEKHKNNSRLDWGVGNKYFS